MKAITVQYVRSLLFLRAQGESNISDGCLSWFIVWVPKGAHTRFQLRVKRRQSRTQVFRLLTQEGAREKNANPSRPHQRTATERKTSRSFHDFCAPTEITQLIHFKTGETETGIFNFFQNSGRLEKPFNESIPQNWGFSPSHSRQLVDFGIKRSMHWDVVLFGRFVDLAQICPRYPVISFHGHFVPSHFVPKYSQFVPQNSQFVPRDS